MTTLIVCVFLLHVWMLFSVVYNFWSKPQLNIIEPIHAIDKIAVAILIPARNEGHQIAETLSRLANVGEVCHQILVLDDHSTDGTAQIVAACAQQDPRIQLLRGLDLPNGWLGKHWACHQLGKATTHATHFLFIDADVQITDGAVKKALRLLMEKNLQLVSVFPKQVMLSKGEHLVVPLMHWLLLSLLPLWFIYQFRFKSMAAANGQFMLFEAQSYRKHMWHSQVRNVIVDDIAIMQRIKQIGLSGMTLVGDNSVTCRMYANFGDALNGFAKNLLAGFGNNLVVIWSFLFMVSVLPIILIVMAPFWGICILLVQCIIWAMVKYIASEKLSNLKYWPLTQYFVLTYLTFKTTQWHFSKKGFWKGRSLYP